MSVTGAAQPASRYNNTIFYVPLYTLGQINILRVIKSNATNRPCAFGDVWLGKKLINCM